MAAASTLEPLELAQLPPSQLPLLGKVARGLASEGYKTHVVVALCRVLFVSTNPPQLRMALGALDRRGVGTLEGSEARRLVALLGRLLGGVAVSTAAKLATRLDAEAEGGENKEALERLEMADLGEMLCELSVAGVGGGMVGESLAGLKSLDLAVRPPCAPTMPPSHRPRTPPPARRPALVPPHYPPPTPPRHSLTTTPLSPPHTSG